MDGIDELQKVYEEIEHIEDEVCSEIQFMKKHGFNHEEMFLEARHNGIRSAMGVIRRRMQEINNELAKENELIKRMKELA